MKNIRRFELAALAFVIIMSAILSHDIVKMEGAQRQHHVVHAPTPQGIWARISQSLESRHAQPAQAVVFETLASILMWGFSSLGNQAQYNPTTHGVFSAAQELPPSLQQATQLQVLATEGNVTSNTVIHPLIGTTPYGETFKGLNIYPFCQALGRRYDYTRVFIDGSDVTAGLADKLASRFEYDAERGWIRGMLDSYYFEPSAILAASGRVTNIEFVYSMQKGEKVSVHCGVQPRTLVQLVALARLNENFSHYLADAFGRYFQWNRVTAKDTRRPYTVHITTLAMEQSVDLLVLDTADSPEPGSPQSCRHLTLNPYSTYTIGVAGGQVVLMPNEGTKVGLYATPNPTPNRTSFGKRYYQVGSDLSVEFTTDPNLVKGGE